MNHCGIFLKEKTDFTLKLHIGIHSKWKQLVKGKFAPELVGFLCCSQRQFSVSNDIQIINFFYDMLFVLFKYALNISFAAFSTGQISDKCFNESRLLSERNWGIFKQLLNLSRANFPSISCWVKVNILLREQLFPILDCLMSVRHWRLLSVQKHRKLCWIISIFCFHKTY